MNQILRQVLGLQEHETEGDKISQATVVYLTAEQLPEEGAHCGACMFFRESTSECFLTSPPACNAEHGVCAAFVHGKSIFHKEGTPTQAMPKKQVGYEED